MSIQNEIGYLKPMTHKAHEALVNIVFTGTALKKEAQLVLEPFGLTLAHFNALLMLKDQSVNGKITQTGLGRMLVVNRSNITGLVDRMAKTDLVRRTADPNDRRVNYVEMTEHGHEVMKKANEAYYVHLEDVVTFLSENDINTMIKTLEKLRKQLA